MLVSPASTPLSLPTSLCVVSELWFNDGNIILENEDSTFKVYSGLLARKSSVFKDMFTFPQPAGKEETPTVRLYDSTEALTAFLKAILDPEFFEAPPSATELSIVGGILRLSGKYDTQFLRLRALRHIESTYPSSLDGWKSRDAHRTIPPIVYTPFAVLPLIREFELCWALPAVLYCLCSHSVPQIHDGVEWCERKITINADDRRRVLVGRAELVHLQNHLSLACLRQSPHPDCTSPSDCAEQRRKWLNLISEWDIADPLDCLNENMDGLKSDLCLACFTQSKCKFEEAQVEIWERLPQIFGLSSWTELNALKEEAMNVQ
ncbi:hypothetical protein GYMLUDRAFT_163806 [Collybiopsis luxurians FD-317 M1]|uniref:BTB domain-containing protein n=1 Tax=Collybiopsis luxurians FD-317 M1 TaxID=944289 RepID=A0A0D0BGM1_9AGAR|nr:hypothetical protein GYMLUDRAFT_163806 [Collybiopsis luxurians FD-317 M1]